MSSRLVRAASGRPVAVEVTVPAVGLDHGCRFAVLGNEIGDRGFRFVGSPTGRPPLPDETAVVRRGVTARRQRRTWTDVDRAEARRLQAEGLSQAAIAERVCGDRTYRSTVQLWLRAAAVA